MDPFSIILAALSTGAAAGLKSTTEQVVKEAYTGLKNIIKRRYKNVDVDSYENDPTNEARQAAITQELKNADADRDQELLNKVNILLDLIQKHTPEVFPEVGVNIEDVTAEQSVTLSEINSPSVDIRRSTIKGDLTINRINAGPKESAQKPLVRAVDGNEGLPASGKLLSSIDLNNVSAGRDVKIVQNAHNFFVLKGIDPYSDFTKELLLPFDNSLQGEEDISNLRKKLLKMPQLKEPVLITVKGTLFPCSLLRSGWWDRQNDQNAPQLEWHDGLQKWLFYGFDAWGPSWGVSWDSNVLSAGNEKTPYIAQLGDEDESNSIPVLVPYQKARILWEKFQETWGGFEAEVRGGLVHRSHFKNESFYELLGGTLDYCLLLEGDNKEHKIRPLRYQKTEIYSGYLWKCLAPKKWFDQNKNLDLNQVYIIWEHTNFADQDAVKYNLECLEHKENYISSMHGGLVLLQKSSILVPGTPEWSTKEFHDLLTGKIEEI